METPAERQNVVVVGVDASHHVPFKLALSIADIDFTHLEGADISGVLRGQSAALLLMDPASLGASAQRIYDQVQEFGCGLPIVILVDPEDAETLKCGLANGVADFLLKPLEQRSLAQRVCHVLTRHRKAQVTERRLARIQHIARLGSWVWRFEVGAFQCDEELRRLLGIKRNDASDLREQMTRFVIEEDRGRVVAAIESRRPHRIEYRVQVDSARELSCMQQEVWLTQDEANGEVQLLGTVQDVTQLKDAQKRISRLAYFDVLTGLPNRAFLAEHLAFVLARSRYDKCPKSVLALDLDLFKRVNDTLGHAAGDALLTVVAQRIKESIRKEDLVLRQNGDTANTQATETADAVARVGGDEFIIVLSTIRRPEDAGIVAKRIVDAIERPVVIDATEIFPSCSIGIAIYPNNGTTPEVLLKHADTALYAAKESGRGTFRFFTESMTDAAQRRMEIEAGLRSALDRGEMTLHYQPQIRLLNRTVTGVEALMRWTHEGKSIPPDQFISVAEDAGLIVKLGQWALQTACLKAKEWNERLKGELGIAVNVSARQLATPGFETMVLDTLERTGLPAHLLELEITESTLIADAAASAEVFGNLRKRGIHIALDDFGTGYSSLAYLTRFPIDTLKIDRSFVHELGSTQGSNITVAILAMSRALSLRVVAEGVETQAQLDFLANHDCEEVQGYFFAKPMSVDALDSWLLQASPQSPKTFAP